MPKHHISRRYRDRVREEKRREEKSANELSSVGSVYPSIQPELFAYLATRDFLGWRSYGGCMDVDCVCMHASKGLEGGEIAGRVDGECLYI